MNSLSVREAKANLHKLIDEVSEKQQPIAILGKRNEAVLVSKEDWNAIQETLYLTSIPGMAQSIKEAAVEPIEECTPVESIVWFIK